MALSTTALAIARPSWPPPDWFLVACDVGQGDALVAVRAGPGRAVVVDVGPDPDAVDGCLRGLDVREVPLVLLTHAHADHVDGLPGVLRGRRVGAGAGRSARRPAGALARDLAAAAGRRESPSSRPARRAPHRRGRCSWQVLAPARPLRRHATDPNNSSLVAAPSRPGRRRVLLPVTSSPRPSATCSPGGPDLRADVLKVPHHGSASPGARVPRRGRRPRRATSVGADNTYGHPAAGTLAGRCAGTSFRTDLHGDLALVHRDGRLVVVPRR